MHARAAARASSVMLGRHADEFAVLATGRTGPVFQRRHGRHRRMGLAAPLDLVPHRLRIERQLRPHDDNGEDSQRIDRGPELDRHQIAQLGVGHEHAE